MLENAYALVVGISDYNQSPTFKEKGLTRLSTARKGAEAMAAALTAQGYHIKTLYDAEANSANLVRAIKELFENRKPYDLLLLYYAGHGYPIEEDIYLAPSDFDEDSRKKSGQSLAKLREDYFTKAIQKVVLILDCCYSGAFFDAKSSSNNSNGNHSNNRLNLEDVLWDSFKGTSKFYFENKVLFAATGSYEQSLDNSGGDGYSQLTGKILPVLQGQPAIIEKVVDEEGRLSSSRLASYLEESYHRTKTFLPKDYSIKSSKSGAEDPLVLAMYPKRIIPPNTTLENQGERVETLLKRYLQSLVPLWSHLDLAGLADVRGRTLPLPLEEVYISLQAEKSSAEERNSESRLLDLEILATLREKRLLERMEEAELLELEDATLRSIVRELPYLQKRYLTKLQQDEDLTLHEAVQKHKVLVILGDPGSGKTTLLHYLALQHANALLAGKIEVTIQQQQDQTDKDTDPDNRESLRSFFVPSKDSIRESEPKLISLGPTRLPIIIRSASYAEQLAKKEIALLDFAREHLRNRWQLSLTEKEAEELIQQFQGQSRLLILIDGLDEITDLALRIKVAENIKNFVQQEVRISPPDKPGNQIIITSRVVGYQAAPIQFPVHYRIREMSDGRIKAFLEKFCQTVELAAFRVENNETELDQAKIYQLTQENIQKLTAAIAEKDGRVRRLAVNPLLLSMLALIQRETGTIPHLRFELYEKCFKTLIKTWKPTSEYERTNGMLWDEHWVIRVLGPFSHWLHTERLTGLATETELVVHIAARLNPEKLLPTHIIENQAREFVDKVRRTSGLLVARGEKLYGFMHRTFQEYIVACNLINNPALDFKKFAVAHLYNARWNVPLLLAIGGLSYQHKENELKEDLTYILDQAEKADPLQRNLLFVAEAFLECGEVPSIILKRVTETLLEVYVSSKLAQRFEPLAKQIEELLRRWQTTVWSSTAEVYLLRAFVSFKDNQTKQLIAKLLSNAEWATSRVLLVLRNAETTDNINAGCLYQLRKSYAQLVRKNPLAIPLQRLELRRRCSSNPHLWEVISSNWRLAYLVGSLYEVVGEFKPENISRETPITDWLLSNLETFTHTLLEQNSSYLNKSLAKDCHLFLERNQKATNEWAARAIALIFLTEAVDRRATVNFIIDQLKRIGYSNLLECFTISLALTLLSHDLAIDFDLARNLAIDPDTDLAIDFDLAYTIDLVRNLVIDLDTDLVIDLDTDLALGRTLDRAQLWLKLSNVKKEEKLVIAAKLYSYSQLACSDFVIISLNRLWHEGWDSVWKLLERVRISDSYKLNQDSIIILQEWLDQFPYERQIYPLLLLIEAGILKLSAELIGKIVAFLYNCTDTVRKRISAILKEERELTRLELEVLFKLASSAIEAATRANGFVSLVLYQALRNTEYNDPEKLTILLEQGEKDVSSDNEANLQLVLSHIYSLDINSEKIFCFYLKNSKPSSQLALAESAKWLLQKDKVVLKEIEGTLLVLLRDHTKNTPQLTEKLLEALSCSRQPTEVILEIFHTYTRNSRLSTVAWHCLARLAVQNGDPAIRTNISNLLETGLKHTTNRKVVASAIARFYFMQAGFSAKENSFSPLLRRKASEQETKAQISASDQLEKFVPKPLERLTALIDAGNDDGRWADKYHGELAKAAAAILEKNINLLVDVTERLKQSKQWPEQRIIVATLAQLARCAPALYSINTFPAEIEELLLQACANVESFNVRRFGLVCVSRLRKVTARTNKLLIAACKDFEVVVKDVIEAVQQFREIEPELIDEVIKGLQNESALVRAIIATLLAELCVSAATSKERALLESKILPALATALQNEPNDSFCTYFNEKGEEQAEKLYNILYRCYYRARIT